MLWNSPDRRIKLSPSSQKQFTLNFLFFSLHKENVSGPADNQFFEVDSLTANSFLRIAKLCLILIYIITTFQQHAGLYGCVYVDEDGSDTGVWKALIKSRGFYKAKAKC